MGLCLPPPSPPAHPHTHPTAPATKHHAPHHPRPHCCRPPSKWPASFPLLLFYGLLVSRLLGSVYVYTDTRAGARGGLLGWGGLSFACLPLASSAPAAAAAAFGLGGVMRGRGQASVLVWGRFGVIMNHSGQGGARNPSAFHDTKLAERGNSSMVQLI